MDQHTERISLRRYFSPVGFCLIKPSDGYLMGPPGDRNVKRTHSLFIGGLKIYQQNHEKLKMVNETIVKVSQETGVCYEATKCAEIILNRGRMVKTESLDVLAERMKAVDPKQNKNYKFSGCEQADRSIQMQSTRE